MGFKNWFNNQMERSKSPHYGLHRIWRDEYLYQREGNFTTIRKPLAGARAEFHAGADTERASVTRIAAGAIIAGPVGAVVGGMLKKDRTRAYVTVTFADGDIAIVEGPAKDERLMREFAAQLNMAART